MSADFGVAALAGLGGVVVMTVLMYIMVAFGFRVDIPYLIGTRYVNPDRSGMVYFIGFLLHLMIGILWGFIYTLLMIGMVESPNLMLGFLFGTAHGIFVGVLISTFADRHPHVGQDKAIPDPGMFGNRWGISVPFMIILLHIVYGLTMTYLYNMLYHPELMPAM